MIDVSIPSEFEPFVENAVKNGEFASPDEVVAEGLRFLQRRQNLREAVQAGVAQLDAGQYTEYGEDDLQRFLDDVKAEHAKRTGQPKANP
jgi:putative addiction module CopG family antidote